MSSTTYGIYEVDYSCSPQGVNKFEVYNETLKFLTSFDSLKEAQAYCAEQGVGHSFHSLEEFYAENE